MFNILKLYIASCIFQIGSLTALNTTLRFQFIKKKKPHGAFI